MAVAVMVHAAVPVAGRGGSVEAAPPEDAVRERLGPDADDLVQAAFREPGRERFRALGEGVEERGGKHVPGHPADGIQMNVHPRDSTPVPPGRRNGRRSGTVGSVRKPVASQRPQFLEPLDQFPYVRRGRSPRSTAALRVLDRGGKLFATASVGPATCLSITLDICLKRTDHLLARGGSTGSALERLVREREMEQKPVLEAGCRDGRADLRSACLPA